MAQQAGEKLESGRNQEKRNGRWVIPLLRVLAFSATLVATLVMALNKQTKTIVVATIGSTPIKATLTAKFQHTPAFVFFVITNVMASVHSLLMLALEFIGHKHDMRFVVIAILDLMNVALVSGGASAAAFMGQLGRNGNSHARWNKICDKFDTFCDRGAGAIAASLVGLLLSIIISSILLIKHQNRISKNC